MVDADDARRITRRFDKVQSVYDILNASQGKLWLATLDGVWLYEKSDNSARKVIDTPSRATDLLRDSKGRIWVGGEDCMAVYAQECDGLIQATVSREILFTPLSKTPTARYGPPQTADWHVSIRRTAK